MRFGSNFWKLILFMAFAIVFVNGIVEEGRSEENEPGSPSTIVEKPNKKGRKPAADPHSLKRLYNTLLDKYQKLARPTENGQDEVLIIEFGASLLTMTLPSYGSALHLQTQLQLHLVWKDPGLVWDPNKFNGIKFVSIPIWRIWKPSIILKNSDALHYADPTINTITKVRFDGMVEYHPLAYTDTLCKYDVTYFPFDEQTCNIKFRSSEDRLFVQLKPWKNYSAVLMDEYQQISNWEIVGGTDTNHTMRFHPCCSEALDGVSIDLTFRRSPSHYLYTYFLPFHALSALLPFFFLIDCNLRQILSLALTLGMSLWSRFGIDLWAAYAANTPLLVWNQFVIIGLAMFVFLEAAAFNFLSRKSSEEMPTWLRNVVLPKLGSICGVRRTPRPKAVSREDDQGQDSLIFLGNGPRTSSETKNESNTSWKELGEIADKCLFWIYLLIIIGIHTKLYITFAFLYD